jgi:hypothetical protein
VISDYTGATKTVTLGAGTTFTATTTDNIAIFPPVNVSKWAGIAVTTSTTTTLPEVDVKSISDDATAANNAELMFDGTGYAGGTTKLAVDLVSILGTALTETAGQIAAAFKQFFDVGTPTGTMKAITNVVTCTTNTDMLTTAAILAAVADGTLTVQDSLKLSNAANAGKTAGPVPGTAGTVTLKNTAGTKTRVSTSVDTSGYRTTDPTLDLS